MSKRKINHGGTSSDADGAKRQGIRRRLACIWVENHRPDVWMAIQAAAIKRVPLSDNRSGKHLDEISELPK